MVGSGKRGVHPSDSSGSVLSGGGSYTEIHEEGYCGFTEPFQFSWFFTIVGAEYFHVYLWIAKDFSWTQEFKTLSLFFGTCATLWCIVIFFNAFQVGNNDEVYSTIALFLWIFANYWWMTGDVHDDNYPDEPSIYDQRSNESAIILTTAVCWLTVYYFVIIPFGVMPVSPEAIAAYDDGSFQPRFRLLKTFRQYENLHMYFWLIKDLCWNLNFISMWFVMLVPAVFLAGDFFFIAAFCKNSVVDTVHYATIFLWLCGNVTWALGEFFFTEYDEPIRIWHGSVEARRTARWYSSWILFASFVPLVVMYCVWIPLSLMGKLDNIGVENAEISYDNEGPRNSEWYNPVPYCENEIHAISVSRSPSINTTTLKNIVKVRTSSSDRSFKNKKKKIIASRGDSSSKLHNKSIARFNPSASEDVSEDEEAETAQLLPVPPAGKSIQIMPVAVAVAVSATSEYSLEAGRR